MFANTLTCVPRRHTGAVWLPSKPSASEYSRKRFSLQPDTPQCATPLFIVSPQGQRGHWLACPCGIPQRQASRSLGTEYRSPEHGTANAHTALAPLIHCYSSSVLIHCRRHTGAVWLLPKSFQHSGCDARSLPRLATPPPCLQLFSLRQTHPRMPPLIHRSSSTAKGTVPARWHVHAEYRINMPATPVSGLSYRQSRTLPWHRPPKPCPCSSTAAHPPPSAAPAGHVTSARRTRRRNALIQPGQCFALPADTT